MAIIDAHMHVVPAWYGLTDNMTPAIGAGYGKIRIQGQGLQRLIPPSFVSCTISAELVLEYMEWIGVDKAVLMQAPIYGFHNEYVAEVVEKYPDKFRGLGLVDPRDEKASDKIKYLAKTLKLCGVKFEVGNIPFWLNGKEYWPIWEKILEENLVLALDLGWTDDPHCFQVKQLRNMLESFPDLNVVLVHLGVSRLWDTTQKYPFPFLQQTLDLAEYNVWFDITCMPLLCKEEEYPYPRAQKIIEVTYEKVGSERIIWGSDFPQILKACHYKQTLDLVRNHCNFLTEKDKELILGENAVKVYGFKR